MKYYKFIDDKETTYGYARPKDSFFSLTDLRNVPEEYLKSMDNLFGAVWLKIKEISLYE